MPDTANNPQTPEEALAEYREVVAPVAFYDGCPLNDLKVENKNNPAADNAPDYTQNGFTQY